MTNYQTISYEVADRIATITFNRPDQLNALSPDMIGELRHAYAAAEADDDVWIIVVTGKRPRLLRRRGRDARSPTTAVSSTTSRTCRRTRSGRHRRRERRPFAR